MDRRATRGYRNWIWRLGVPFHITERIAHLGAFTFSSLNLPISWYDVYVRRTVSGRNQTFRTDGQAMRVLKARRLGESGDMPPRKGFEYTRSEMMFSTFFYEIRSGTCNVELQVFLVFPAIWYPLAAVLYWNQADGAIPNFVLLLYTYSLFRYGWFPISNSHSWNSSVNVLKCVAHVKHHFL